MFKNPTKPPRYLRVENIVKKHAGELLQSMYKSDLLTVTKVRVSADLKHASIWVSSLKTSYAEAQMDADSEKFEHTLNKLLKKNLTSKNIPRTTLRWDDSSAYQDRIHRKIEEIKGK